MTLRLIILLLALLAADSRADVAFLAAPRTGGFFQTQSVSEWGADGDTRKGGVRVYHGNAQLIVRSDDGSERVLVPGGALDFSVCHDGRGFLASIVAGGRSDIYRIDAATGNAERLTNGPGWNCQPVELGDGSIAFLSDRDNWQNPNESYRAFTIYRMNVQGREVKRLWHAGLGGVFGLHVGPDGRLYFSSGENQGGRPGNGNNWAIWSVGPWGEGFQPEITVVEADPNADNPFDWPCITSDGSLVVNKYYDTRIYGTLLCCPNPRRQGHPLWQNNPKISNGYRNGGGASFQFCYQPVGMFSLTPWTHDDDADAQAPKPGGGLEYVGHVAHPAAIPDNGVWFTWTGPNRDGAMDLGVYEIPDARKAAANWRDLIPVVDEPDRHEWMGKPLVPYTAIYEKPHPAIVPAPRNGSSPDLKIGYETRLPVGSPFGQVMSPGIDYNEWVTYGSPAPLTKFQSLAPDAGAWLRVLAFVPTLNRFDGRFVEVINSMPWTQPHAQRNGFSTPVNEITGFYDQLIPLQHWQGPDGQAYSGPDPPAGYERIMREDGKFDNSFRFLLPANQPWTFQLLNAKKEAIVTARTWHQVAPEETRNCTGCHAHWKPDPYAFLDTFAASKDYQLVRLDTVKTVVYQRDLAALPGIHGPRAWDSKAAGAPHPYASAGQSFDDNPAWTEDQRELYRAWQDTAFLAETQMSDGGPIPPNEGPYKDTIGPTVSIKRTPNFCAIGLVDPQTGIADARVYAEGLGEVTERYRWGEKARVMSGPSFWPRTLTVVATDGAGNVTTVEALK